MQVLKFPVWPSKTHCCSQTCTTWAGIEAHSQRAPVSWWVPLLTACISHTHTVRRKFPYQLNTKHQSVSAVFLVFKQEKQQKQFGTSDYTMPKQKNPLQVSLRNCFLNHALKLNLSCCVIPKHGYFPSLLMIALAFLPFRELDVTMGRPGYVRI